MTDEHPKVLCVDDEPLVLAGLERTLFGHFDVFTATSGSEGLEILDEDGPFSVIVSDMTMPHMDGATFLANASRRAPDSVRVLLTGNADLDTPVAAVNQGQIFRFLSKPCPPDVLIDTLLQAHQRFEHRQIEREILEKTVRGSVQMLVKLLELLAPTAFSRASRMAVYVRHVANDLGLEDAWIYETAALLSQAGCVTLPPETLQKLDEGRGLSRPELEMVERGLQTAVDLIGGVPRLEVIGQMIALAATTKRNLEDPVVEMGVQLLVASRGIDEMTRAGRTYTEAVSSLKGVDARVLQSLHGYTVPAPEVRTLSLNELRSGMTLQQDVHSESGLMVATKGQELSAAMIERLDNFNRTTGIRQPIAIIG